MKVIVNLLGKEVRELLTRQMLVPLVAIALLFAVIGKLVRSEQAKGSGPHQVVIADYDRSALSQRIKWFLESEHLVLTEAQGDREATLKQAKDEGVNWVIVIPKGLEKSIEVMETGEVEIYGVFQGFSITQTMKGVEIKQLITALNNQLAQDHLAKVSPAVKPENLLLPLRPKQFVVVKDRVVAGTPEMLSEIVMSQTFMIPMVLMLVIIYASQMIAASIGQEKENKTLETLLTVPIDRLSIVLGKMLGAGLFSLIITGVFMLGFSYYMGAVMGEQSIGTNIDSQMVNELGLGITLQGYILVGFALFLAVVCALSLATLLSVFADDAKSAHTAVMPVIFLVMLPFFLTMFFDITTASLPVRILVYAIPFSYPFLVPKAVMFGNYSIVGFGFLYMALFAGIMIFLAARVFATDRILTAKLRLGKKQS